MCANATSTASPSSPSVSSGRSLLSRLTSPLRSRTRNLTDFHIRPDEPHRQYSPGDLVKGAVILTVVKPIRITHLTVCLHGFVRVFKHPNGVNDPPPVDAGLTAGSQPRKTQYFGNGHASLFQDEVTLCGEGRLEAGVYEFNFELEFPQKGLPTSIDFERGTISYMISSTVTRPTSIATTSSCDQKISLVETVDIGPMLPPKPRTISLEPISRRTRRAKTVKLKEVVSQETADSGSGASVAIQLTSSPHPDESASQCGSTDHQADSRGPVTSDIQSNFSTINSADSTISSSTGLSFRKGAAPPAAKSTHDSQQTSSKILLADKTITAIIEMAKSGCLPGDNIPLKISIKHSKAIKSMHGIIITLYRQGRIDSAPPLSLFVDIKGKAADRLKHEEYYPKSKTGLGGLSLSSAGSSSIFRKDLAQTFAPILVDPISLTAVINASVRVPEDAFPTITGVPGQMISFKYHIEVVVDLGGKLAGQQRHVPRVGTLSMPSCFAPAGLRGDGNPSMLTAWGGSIVDTDHIRREKSVVACVFEVIVGTTDTARKRGRGVSLISSQTNGASEEMPVTPALVGHEPIYEETPVTANAHVYNGDQAQPYPYYEAHYPEYYSNNGYDYHENYPDQNPPAAQIEIQVPPPEIEVDQDLSEKERVRRAEQRLLPSQPPPDSQEPSSSTTIVPPSAPSVLSEGPEDDLYSSENVTPLAAQNINRILSHANLAVSHSPPLASSFEEGHSNANPQESEDKQELEHRRMLGEASAPPEFAVDDDENGGEGSSRRHQHEPSAPTLHDDEYGGQNSHHRFGPSTHNETLPKYER